MARLNDLLMRALNGKNLEYSGLALDVLCALRGPDAAEDGDARRTLHWDAKLNYTSPIRDWAVYHTHDSSAGWMVYLDGFRVEDRRAGYGGKFIDVLGGPLTIEKVSLLMLALDMEKGRYNEHWRSHVRRAYEAIAALEGWYPSLHESGVGVSSCDPGVPDAIPS